MPDASSLLKRLQVVQSSDVVANDRDQSWLKFMPFEDDPFIPTEPFLESVFPPQLALELIPSGGHLGYLSSKTWLGDRRWLDARIVAWLASHWKLGRRDCPAPLTPR
jgi:hypothetical protein